MKQKKPIPFQKYVRVGNNPEAVRCRICTTNIRGKGDSYKKQISIESYILGDYVYAIMPCQKQGSDKLNTYTVRYLLNTGGLVRADNMIVLEKYHV